MFLFSFVKFPFTDKQLLHPMQTNWNPNQIELYRAVGRLVGIRLKKCLNNFNWYGNLQNENCYYYCYCYGINIGEGDSDIDGDDDDGDR